MGRVVIREYRDMKHDRSGLASGLILGQLATDHLGLPIKSVDTVGGTAVDCLPLTSRTNFVALEAVDSDIRYKVRTKKFRYTPAPATDDDNPIPAGSVVMEAVYPGAVISFLQTSGLGGVTTPAGPFLTSQYIPVLSL